MTDPNPRWRSDRIRVALAAIELQHALNACPGTLEARIDHFDVCRAGEPMRRRFVVEVVAREPAAALAEQEIER